MLVILNLIRSIKAHRLFGSLLLSVGGIMSALQVVTSALGDLTKTFMSSLRVQSVKLNKFSVGNLSAYVAFHRRWMIMVTGCRVSSRYYPPVVPK